MPKRAGSLIGTFIVEIRAVILSSAWIVAVSPSIQPAWAVPQPSSRASAAIAAAGSGRIIAGREYRLAEKVGQADRIPRVIDHVAGLKHVFLGPGHQLQIVAAKQ